MAASLDYLNPDLQPLVQKVEEYLAAKEELRKLVVAERNEPLHDAQVTAAAEAFEMRPPTGSYDQHADELRLRHENAQEDVQRLAGEVLALLPTRDEWVKVNLGYGPSRVGAWRVPGSSQKPQEENYEIRVVV